MTGLGVLLKYVCDEYNASKYILLILLIATGAWWLEANLAPRNHLQPAYFNALQWTQTHLPKGSHIGAFNSGGFGSYLGEGYVVSNLDGIVNHSAFGGIKSGETCRIC